MTRIVGMLLLLIGIASVACAVDPPSAPEIDPASGISAISLLSGALLLVGRRRRS